MDRFVADSTVSTDATGGGGMDQARPPRPVANGLGLSGKLLLLTSLFVMLAEVLIFVPSIANFRANWLKERMVQAQIAAIAAEAAPGGMLPPMLREELLMALQMKAVSAKRNDQRSMILEAEMPTDVDAVYDLGTSSRFGLMTDAIMTMLAPAGRTIRVIGPKARDKPDNFVDIVIAEAPLKTAMLQFSANILGLSIVISMITAALVYLALNTMFVRPMQRITHNMVRFSERPEDLSRIMAPSKRYDEIGIAERELAHMQQELAQMLHQKSRLAALGLAVSKISHDLRNMLASAQILSDRLITLPDPSVQRLAPKLIGSLDRAIKLCANTLTFGRAEEAAPERRVMPLRELVEEVGDNLGLPRAGTIDWQVAIHHHVSVDADRDQLYRVLSNIMRNSVQTLEAQLETEPAQAPLRVEVRAWREAHSVTIDVADNGPGVPRVAREHLFEAFQGSTRKGGSGLGLAISAEIIQAHGGELTLLDNGNGDSKLADRNRGATFRIVLPDREADG